MDTTQSPATIKVLDATSAPASQTPSQTIIDAANATVTVTDPRGRQITIKDLSALDKMRLASLVGAQNVKNEVVMGYAKLAYTVMAIDGQPQPRLTTWLKVEALVQRLGDDGLIAIGTAMAKHFWASQPDQNDDGQESLKNA